MDSTIYQCFASCPRGLEAALKEELDTFGIPTDRQTEGGLSFRGPLDAVYRANLKSRIASRILVQVAHHPYQTETDVYHTTLALSWSSWFQPSSSIKVKVSGKRCPLNSLDFVTLRIKDAICDHFMRTARVRPSIDTRRPDIRIEAFLDATHLTLYLDTSGEPLFKRGLRPTTVDAPLRENLAAGLLRLARWHPAEVLLDPMCGGGTIPVEAAHRARDIAPGLSRRFALERFRFHDAEHWDRLRLTLRARPRSQAPAGIWASDWNAAAVRAAQQAFHVAGVAADINIKQCDLFSLEAPAEHGVLMMNPPYGVRLAHPGDLESFYPRLGDWLKTRFSGWRVYIFTGDLRLPKLIGLLPARRIPLYNGALECRLYEFIMVAGSMRKRSLSGQTR